MSRFDVVIEDAIVSGLRVTIVPSDGDELLDLLIRDGRSTANSTSTERSTGRDRR